MLLDGAGISGSPDTTLSWLHNRIAGDTTQRAGNVVILRASYTNIDDQHFYVTGNLASVQTVLIPPCATAAQVDRIAPIVNTADAVYFAGGDQANYVRWKGTALITAVKRVYERGGVVGGGSAGLAIQGAVVYDSVAADRLDNDTHTPDALRDPLEPRISFTTGFFAWPALANTITDTHFVVRDRFGRTAVFLARIFHDALLPPTDNIYALGIDEGSAVVVDPDGSATVLNKNGANGAYLIRTSASAALLRGKPLPPYTVEISHIAHDGEKFDLLDKTDARTVVHRYRRRFAKAAVQQRPVSSTMSADYAQLEAQAAALYDETSDFTTNAGNFAALINTNCTTSTGPASISRRLTAISYSDRLAANRRARASLKAAASAVRRRNNAQRSSYRMSTHSTAISPATSRRAARSSCRYCARANCGQCSMSTARNSIASPRPTARASNASLRRILEERTCPAFSAICVAAPDRRAVERTVHCREICVRTRPPGPPVKSCTTLSDPDGVIVKIVPSLLGFFARRASGAAPVPP